MSLNLSISARASAALERLARQHPGQDLFISVEQECGCGKMAYHLEWKPKAEAAEWFVEVGPVRLVTSEGFRDAVDGADIDYHDSLMEKKFIIRHPRVVTECQGPRA
ncbi:MAG: hypothetical protein K6U87_12495 [Firmicutes bacterium]|nr:hypothetical protein [Bacillota bacterium]